jgi:hypothetical protein
MKYSNNKMYLGRGNSLNRGDVDVLSWICAINKKICRDKWSSSLFVCIPNNCALLVNSFSVVFKLLLLFTSLNRSLFFYWSAYIKSVKWAEVIYICVHVVKGIQAVRIEFFFKLKVANIRCFILIAVDIFHNIIRK